jgi:hypothetical protein
LRGIVLLFFGVLPCPDRKNLSLRVVKNDSKTFQITSNCSSGLPWKVCREWRRRSFQDFPDVLAQFRNPKTKGAAQRVRIEDSTVGDWAKKFTDIETSPRNASKNRPYSLGTMNAYKTYGNTHSKSDPFAGLIMSEMELAVCACMFPSGLHRVEIAALKPDCLDWSAPKITLKYSWQRHNKRTGAGAHKEQKAREASLPDE